MEAKNFFVSAVLSALMVIVN